MGAASLPGSNELPGPYELLDLEHGSSIMLTIHSWQQGWIEIHPKQPSPRQIRLMMLQKGLTAAPAPGHPISVQVPALRLFATRLDKSSPAPYFDVTSLRLQANLIPRLQVAGGNPLTVTITADGYKPTKQFSVEQG